MFQKILSIFDRVSSLSAGEQLQLLNDLFVHYAKEQYSLHVPSDFIELTLRGVVQLKDRGRHDVIYGLSKGLGTTRPDKSDSLFPTTRMPMGLLEYMVQFVNCKPGQHVREIYIVVVVPVSGTTKSVAIRIYCSTPLTPPPLSWLDICLSKFGCQATDYKYVCMYVCIPECMYIFPENMQVTCCDEYLQWLQSMYALFGTKWSKLYCRPMLCIESTEQGSRISCNGVFNPLMERSSSYRTYPQEKYCCQPLSSNIRYSGEYRISGINTCTCIYL